MIYYGDVDRSRTRLPSPTELKRRILIKAKKLETTKSIPSVTLMNQHFECPEESRTHSKSKPKQSLTFFAPLDRTAHETPLRK